MVPGRYDITIYRGKTWSITLEAKNAQGVAINFDTAYDSFRMQIRPAWRTGPIPSEKALFELTSTNGRIITINGGLQLKLAIDAVDTAKLDFTAGKYELELVKDGVVETVDPLLYGSVNVTDEITV